MTIVKKFGNTKIEFKEIDDDIWVKVPDIGRALEYKFPAAGARNLFNRHKDELNEFSYATQLESGEIRYLNEQGVYIFCMLSKADKAKEFRRWVSKVLKYLRKKVDLSPMEYLLEQAKRLVELEKQGQTMIIQIEQHTKKIDYIQTILLPDTTITEEQAENIREAVGTIAYRYNDNNPPFGMVWGRLKNEIGFASYRQIPRERYPSVMEFLDYWLRKIKNR